MRKNIKNTEAIFPMPVLIIGTYNEDGSVNAMNAAWGTMKSRDKVMLSLGENHKTMKNILERKSFTVSIADSSHMIEADYLGITSGNNVKDKFSKCGLTSSKSEFVDAPIINELPICIECIMDDYTDGVLTGSIKNTSVIEDIFEDDNINITKLSPLAFDPYTHGYYEVTKRVGNAFKEGLKIKNNEKDNI